MEYEQQVKSYIDLLGHIVKDKVTGLQGTVTSLCFDLYGCIQVAIHPGLGKDGQPLETRWYDISRVNKISGDGKPVMEHPFYTSTPAQNGDQGSCESRPTAKA